MRCLPHRGGKLRESFTLVSDPRDAAGRVRDRVDEFQGGPVTGTVRPLLGVVGGRDRRRRLHVLTTRALN